VTIKTVVLAGKQKKQRKSRDERIKAKQKENKEARIETKNNQGDAIIIEISAKPFKENNQNILSKN